MLAKKDDTTRFDRAVELAQKEIDEVFAADGRVTVIVAKLDASYLISQRMTKEDGDTLKGQLSDLTCSYGVGDIDGAMALAEDTLVLNPEAEVILYTATTYTNPGDVNVVNVSEEGEWNAAILSATATLEDGYYNFTVEVACYGSADKLVSLECEIAGYNGTLDTNKIILPSVEVETYGEETITVYYSVQALSDGYNSIAAPLGDNKFYSFTSAFFYLDVQDSFSEDNEFWIYGATRPTLKVQYYTATPNPFYSAILMSLSQNLKDDWNIEIKEMKSGDPALEGYDFYLFEGYSPKTLPTDGVVFLANPTETIVGSGFTLGRTVTIKNWSGDGASLNPGVDHEIMNYVNIDSFALTAYTTVNESDLDGYDVLMYYQSNPVFFVRNDSSAKTVVATYSVKTSTFNINYNLFIIMANVITYIFPRTFAENLYDCYDTVAFTPRGDELTLSHDGEALIECAPGESSDTEWYLTHYGTYTVTQTLLSGEKLEEKFYVTIPRDESNIDQTESAPFNLNRESIDRSYYDDLLIYFAAGLVALLFLEWLLHSLKGM
jgi:hypothetical protein